MTHPASPLLARLARRAARAARAARARPARPGAPEQPRLGFVFVVTYGRSGSTLLTGVLNSIPGYLLRGENKDAVHHLYAFHRTVMAERRRVGAESSAEPTHPYFGIAGYRHRQALVRIRRLVVDTLLRPEPGTRVTGFKEIRWYHPDLEEYVAWLREVFPGARFVLNTREHADVLKSRWWAKGDPEQNARTLVDVEARLLRLVADLGDAAYHVHYDDYVADPGVLRGLFAWLGEEYDEAAVTATMAVRHSI